MIREVGRNKVSKRLEFIFWVEILHCKSFGSLLPVSNIVSFLRSDLLDV